MRKAVFLDRDGCIIEDKDFLTDPSEIRMLPGVAEGLRRLERAGFLLLIVSNQSGVARGYLDETRLEEIHERLTEMLLEQGVRVAGIYYCPHLPEGTVARYAIECDCRKPKPGMLLEAAKEHDVDLSVSYMVGDMLRDVEAGAAAGCRGILIGEEVPGAWPKAESLEEAARMILRETADS